MERGWKERSLISIMVLQWMMVRHARAIVTVHGMDGYG